MGDVRYAKFRVGDLLGSAKLGKYHNPKDLYFDASGYRYICASNANNGVNKQMPSVNGSNLNIIGPRIIAWGKQCPMFTYHDVECVTSQGMYYYDVSALSERASLYVIGALTACVVNSHYGYSNCLIGKVADELIIELPVTSASMPDWDYMAERIAELEAERIAELEAERIAELEAYLVATGLDDCELTDDDREVLGREVETKEFRVGELFEVRTTKSTDRKNVVFDDSGKYEFVGRSKANNCVQGRVSKFGFDANPKGTLSVVQIGDICCTYRNEPWYASQNIFCLKPLVELDELSALYMATCINKALSQFEGGYVSYPTKKSLQQLDCVVPVTSAGTPDWDYMRAYMRAQEKLVMAGVADMTQERIDATREIVGA